MDIESLVRLTLNYIKRKDEYHVFIHNQDKENEFHNLLRLKDWLAFNTHLINLILEYDCIFNYRWLLNGIILRDGNRKRWLWETYFYEYETEHIKRHFGKTKTNMPQ